MVGVITQWYSSHPQPLALGNHNLWLQCFSVLAPTVSVGSAHSPRPNVPPFQSHVKEERGLWRGIWKIRAGYDHGLVCLHQLSFPILAKQHHTLWVEWPFIFSSHFILLIWYIVPRGYQHGSYLVLFWNRTTKILNPDRLMSAWKHFSYFNLISIDVPLSIISTPTHTYPPTHPCTLSFFVVDLM